MGQKLGTHYWDGFNASGAGLGLVRECNLGGPVPQGRPWGWVGWVGRGMRAPKYLQLPESFCGSCCRTPSALLWPMAFHSYVIAVGTHVGLKAMGYSEGPAPSPAASASPSGPGWETAMKGHQPDGARLGGGAYRGFGARLCDLGQVTSPALVLVLHSEMKRLDW